MGLKVHINGTLHEKDEAKVSVFDHGLLYGDGVFEGIRAYNGAVFKCREHIDRLFDSAKAISLTIPMTKEEMEKAIYDTLEVNSLRDAYIRLIVTRGVGKLGLDPYKCSDPQVIIITDSIELYPKELYEQGLDIITAATTRNFPESLNPRIKSLNYLNNILAKIEAINAGTVEAIMMNAQGCVAECTGDNIFIIRGDELVTPPPHAGILRGITRAVVMGLGREAGLDVHEMDLTRFDLYAADECFLTGTAAEIIPVVKIDMRPIGDGKPGPKTLDLLARFRALTESG